MPHTGKQAHLCRNGVGEFSIIEISTDGSKRSEFGPDVFSIQVIFIAESIVIADAIRHNDKKVFGVRLPARRIFCGDGCSEYHEK